MERSIARILHTIVCLWIHMHMIEYLYIKWKDLSNTDINGKVSFRMY